MGFLAMEDRNAAMTGVTGLGPDRSRTLADDVALLGLDLLMRGTGFSRGGGNPFLLDY
jgi:hypothetical protein